MGKEKQTDLRIDKYLWFTRLVKSRSLAAKLVQTGKIRVNKVHLRKASTTVKVGDVITAILGRNVRVIEVAELGKRRGPAKEAQLLYKDLTPESVAPRKKIKRANLPVAYREPGSGRPTKKQRRQTDFLRGQ